MSKKTSKPEKLIKLVAVIGMQICPPLKMLRIYYLAKKKANSILKLKPISFITYCKMSNDKITIVEDEQKRKVYQPEYFPKGEAKEYEFLSPAIYIAELKNAIVHGGSGIIICNDLAITDICANDVENRVKYSAGPIRIGNKKAFYVEVSEEIDEIDTAIDLCGLASWNYFHLTFEILSRYGYLQQYVKDQNIPVLLDEGAREYPQYEELVKKVLKDTGIIYVPEFKRVRCKKLICPSMNTWMPFNVRKKNDFRISDNLLAYSAITNIQKAAEEYRLPKGDRKIFVSRENTNFSRMANETEILRLFKDNGYEIICTEEFTYRQQVEIFSSAACIVGASGAALTNVVYCNPGAVFGCVFPRKNEFCIYSSIAYMVGCKVLFLDAKVIKPGKTISEEQYRVNMDECRCYIEKLDEIIKNNASVFPNRIFSCD